MTTRLTDASGPSIFPKRLGKIDLIIASPECTHHSVARGAKPRDEESRRSGWYVMGLIEKQNPRWVVLENVTPMSGWPGFDELIARLKRSFKGVKWRQVDRLVDIGAVWSSDAMNDCIRHRARSFSRLDQQDAHVSVKSARFDVRQNRGDGRSRNQRIGRLCRRAIELNAGPSLARWLEAIESKGVY